MKHTYIIYNKKKKCASYFNETYKIYNDISKEYYRFLHMICFVKVVFRKSTDGKFYIYLLINFCSFMPSRVQYYIVVWTAVLDLHTVVTANWILFLLTILRNIDFFIYPRWCRFGGLNPSVKKLLKF